MQQDTWKQKVQSASFRGVPFRVESTSTEGGRRVEVIEYPARDLPYADDHGAKAERYSINGFVISDANEDYFQKRTALIEALTKSGGGELVHPDYGLLVVQVEEWRIDQSKSRRGIAFFEMVFVEKGALELPSVQSDTGSQLLSASKLVEEQSAAQLAEKLVVDKQPEFVIQSMVDQVNAGFSAINRLNGRIDAAIAPVAELSQAIDNVTDQASELIRKPVELANATADIFQSLYAIPSSVQDAFSSYKQISDAFRAITNFGNATASQFAQTSNSEEFSRFMVSGNVTAYASAIAESGAGQFTDSQSAKDIRDQLLADIDSISEVDDPDAYLALRAMRMRITEHMNDVALRLPVVKYQSFRATIPLEVFGYMVHGAALTEAKLDEMIERNSIPLTASIPAGFVMEYTTDG